MPVLCTPTAWPLLNVEFLGPLPSWALMDQTLAHSSACDQPTSLSGGRAGGPLEKLDSTLNFPPPVFSTDIIHFSITPRLGDSESLPLELCAQPPLTRPHTPLCRDLLYSFVNRSFQQDRTYYRDSLKHICNLYSLHLVVLGGH